MSYASIVPLIGGETIAMEKVFGSRPEYILSYSGFEANDQHLLNYYSNSVPYVLLDQSSYNPRNVDVVNTVCPCAGLSSLSPTSSGSSATNDWMVNSAEYVLESIKPMVFWGENAPRLASKMGEPVVRRLRDIGKRNGYTFSIYKTKSILHGLSQVRDRTFYFFWKGEKVPQFEYIKREHEKIEETIRSVKRDPNDQMNVLTNLAVPSENPYYKYVLQEIEGGIDHYTFSSKIKKTTGVYTYIEAHTTYDKVSEWMTKNGYDNEAKKCMKKYHKLKSGGNIMRHGLEVPKDFIGAFVGNKVNSLTHPDEDRYLTIRECLSIMKLPDDFILQGGIKNLNHICQNVPVTTAIDMAEHVQKFVDGRLDNQLIDTDFIIQDNKNQSINYEKSSVQLEQFMV